MEQPTVTYEGISIAYIERSDEWEFELRGRTRRAPSLSKAKELINKEPAEKRVKPWEPFQCYQWERYGSEGVTKSTVTSCAGRARYSNGIEWWVKTSKGKREKVSTDQLFAITPDNDKRIAEWKELDAQIDELQAKQAKLRASLKQIETPKGTDTGEQ